MKRHALGTRMISVMIAAAFLLSALAPTLSFERVWADSAPGSPEPVKELNAGAFMLPQELGYIKESVKFPDSTKTVIHIQDAHCNYYAQQKISEILNYLTNEYGISAVNCEGAAEGYDLSPFTDIPEKDIREKTSDFFVREGVVSAAEYFAVNNPRKVDLWGVEAADLYLKNLKVYRESLTYKSEADKYIKSISYVLGNLKSRIYSPELLEFDNTYAKYKDGRLGFKEYVAYLIALSGKGMVDIKAFPNVYFLGQTLRDEERIDFKSADIQKDEVVDRLKKVFSRNELKELVEKAAWVKTEHISQGDFYAYLVKKAKSIRLDLKDYPELEKYIVYISVYSAIDKSKVSKELDALEDRIKESLYQNDTQRELAVLSKDLVLEKNMFNISFTTDDYVYYRQHREAFAVTNFARFIEKYAPLYKIQAKLDPNIGMLDTYREKMEVFYNCSLERDKAFVKNIRFTDHGRPNSIIITGGFHTENLGELFKGENISYISIIPKFTSPAGYESPYLKRLAGQRTALENVIDTAVPAVLNLQVAQILSKRIALIVDGELRLKLFKYLEVPAIAAFMRGESFVLKVVGKNIKVNGAKNEEEKFITFPRGEGADIVGTPTVSTTIRQDQKIDAILTEKAGALNFQLAAPQSQAPAETAPGQSPATAPPTSAVKPLGEIACEAALKPSTAIASSVRKDTATRILTIVATAEDKYLVAGLGQDARNIMGADTNIHINSYMANNEPSIEMDELKKKLRIELREFITKDLAKKHPLMEIRAKEGVDIQGVVKDVLAELSPEAGIDNVMKRIKFVRVKLEAGKPTNQAVQFFNDLGMLECYRYTNGDRDLKDMPTDLANNFLALLKLSITNWDTDFKDKDISEILNMIFVLGRALEIKPADFTKFDDWNRANHKLMQSA